MRRKCSLPVIVIALISLQVVNHAVAEQQQISTDAPILDFKDTETTNWRIVNDGVMGGRSKGYHQIAEGILRFDGKLVTRGGGFTSVVISLTADFSDYQGLALKVRGSGRSFELEVNDGMRYGWRTVSRRAPFETTSEWQMVRVPFTALRSTIFGRSVDAPTVDLSRISRLGFYILDGIDGPFWLEVDAVSLYR